MSVAATTFATIMATYESQPESLSVNSRIDVSVTFSFKGETHAPRVTLELDRFLEKEGKLPDIYLLLAQENGIGLYSYEFEVLQAYPLEFSAAEGLAADFLDGGTFDAEGFVAEWKRQKVVTQLAVIATRHLGEVELSAQPALEAALLEAYELGQQAPREIAEQHL